MTEVTDYTALLSGSYWGGIEVTGKPVFVTYSFPTAAQAEHADILGAGALSSFATFNATAQDAARDALDAWSSVSGITFLEVAPGQGEIDFSLYDFSGTWADGAGGIAYYPFGDWNGWTFPNFTSDWPNSGDVFMNSDYAPGGVPDYGTLLHEIGHALGFKHPNESVWSPTTLHDETLPGALDDRAYTIMSYNGAASTVLGSLDVDAVQHVYGGAGTQGTQVASWSWDSVHFVLTQTGFATDDVIRGVSVKDVIDAGNGNDKVFSLGGDDSVLGGAGNDTVYAGEGNDTVDGGAGDDWILGGDGNDSIMGYSGNNTLEGGAGDDTVIGWAHPDYILGGDGNDSLYGGSANDTIYGGTGNDHIDGYNHDDWLFGEDGGDTITGGSGNDYIDGGAGSDSLLGGDGNDTLIGYSGANTMDGGAGNDTITGWAHVDLIYGGSGNDSLYAGSANDTVYGGEGHDSIDGSNNDDLLLGEAGRDTLLGGAGNDTLDGGSWIDLLTGGAGADRFIFGQYYSGIGVGNRDIVTDFSHAQGDRIDFSSYASGASFVGTGAFHGTGAEIRYFQSGGSTIVELDATGNGSANYQIELTGLLTLVGGDFIV